MNNCPFCKFNDKAVIVYEDEVSYAIVSDKPINKYHLLIIPRQHYSNFIELPKELVSHLFVVAQKLSIGIRVTCQPDAVHHIFDDDITHKGFNLIEHFKIHIIPRFSNDKVKIDWGRENLDIKTRTDIAKKLLKLNQ